MDYRDDLVFVRTTAIREIGDGHTGYNSSMDIHFYVRGFQALDENAVSAGALFLDTVGFAGFSTAPARPMMIWCNYCKKRTERQVPLQHVFFGCQRERAQGRHTRSLSTQEGTPLSRLYSRDAALGLTDIIGCSPSTYYLQSDITEPNSHGDSFSEGSAYAPAFQRNASKVYAISLRRSGSICLLVSDAGGGCCRPDAICKSQRLFWPG
jgi:hypothetical protein